MAINSPTAAENEESLKAPPIAPAAPKRPRRVGVWIALAILAVAGYGGFRYFQAAQQKQRAATAAQAAATANRRAPVTAVPVRTGDLPVYLRGLGSVTAFNTVTVKSRVDGQLIAVHFQEGQFVKKGELLAEIDPRPFQVQLEQAAGTTGPRPGAAERRQGEPGALPGAVGARASSPSSSSIRRRASVGQFEGTIAGRPGGHRQREAAADLSRRSPRRSADASGCGRWTSATSSTPPMPNGLVVITQMQPIAVLFTIPADNLPPVLTKLRAGAQLPVDAYDRDGPQQDCHRHAADRGQPDRSRPPARRG